MATRPMKESEALSQVRQLREICNARKNKGRLDNAHKDKVKDRVRDSNRPDKARGSNLLRKGNRVPHNRHGDRMDPPARRAAVAAMTGAAYRTQWAN